MIKTTQTPATQLLKKHQISYEPYYYIYQNHGGSDLCAVSLAIDEYLVIKTLIMENESQSPLIVLMHGNFTVATGALAKQIQQQKIQLCDTKTAQRHSGYLTGGTSPFGTKRKMPVYMQETIATLPFIYINGGRRGFVIKIETQVLIDLLQPVFFNAKSA